MIIYITDEHDAHGLTFKLIIEHENPAKAEDEEIFEELRRLLSGQFIKEGISALCSYEISTKGSRIEIGLSEEMKLMAKVDNRWNSCREDQKFVVVRLEGDPKNYQWDPDRCPHFECYWCHEETWGVKRGTVEVYDPKEKRMVVVNVHPDCQMEREKQIAMIPYAASTKV